MRGSSCVSFGPELASHGLRLCPSDLNHANFMKDEENRIVALDFGGYSFLPPSFFAFTLKHGDPSGFTQRIASRVVYPPSTELAAMMSASCALVPFSSNDISEQISLLSFLFPASLPLTRIPSSMCCTGLSEELKSRLQ